MELVSEASHGNLAQVQKYLNMGVDVDSEDDQGNSALFVASLLGHIEVVQELLSRNAAVDKPNKKGLTPLIVAAHKGHLDVVETLIRVGHADVHKRFSKSDTTALMFACTHNKNADISKALLDASGDLIDAQDINGLTALMLACMQGRVDQVRFLLTRGADLSKKCKDGLTALDYATTKGEQNIIQALKDAPLVNAKTQGNQDVTIQVLKDVSPILAIFFHAFMFYFSSFYCFSNLHLSSLSLIRVIRILLFQH